MYVDDSCQLHHFAACKWKDAVHRGSSVPHILHSIYELIIKGQIPLRYPGRKLAYHLAR